MKKNVYVNYIGDRGVSLQIDCGSRSNEWILEEIFAMFNHGSRYECKEFLNLKIRSLSMNDCVRVNDQWYQCASIGWEEITNERVEELEQLVVNHPHFEEHGPWFALNEVMRAYRRQLQADFERGTPI